MSFLGHAFSWIKDILDDPETSNWSGLFGPTQVKERYGQLLQYLVDTRHMTYTMNIKFQLCQTRISTSQYSCWLCHKTWSTVMYASHAQSDLMSLTLRAKLTAWSGPERNLQTRKRYPIFHLLNENQDFHGLHVSHFNGRRNVIAKLQHTYFKLKQQWCSLSLTNLDAAIHSPILNALVCACEQGTYKGHKMKWIFVQLHSPLRKVTETFSSLASKVVQLMVSSQGRVRGRY